MKIKIGGEDVEVYGKHMRGENERPMSVEEVEAKFVELSPKHDDATRKAVCLRLRATLRIERSTTLSARCASTRRKD